jgi:hypothetical protein
MIFFLWTKPCHYNYDDEYSNSKVLIQVWITIVEVNMTMWKNVKNNELGQAHPWVVPLGTSHFDFSGPIIGNT